MRMNKKKIEFDDDVEKQGVWFIRFHTIKTAIHLHLIFQKQVCKEKTNFLCWIKILKGQQENISSVYKLQ